MLRLLLVASIALVAAAPSDREHHSKATTKRVKRTKRRMTSECITDADCTVGVCECGDPATSSARRLFGAPAASCVCAVKPPSSPPAMPPMVFYDDFTGTQLSNLWEVSPNAGGNPFVYLTGDGAAYVDVLTDRGDIGDVRHVLPDRAGPSPAATDPRGSAAGPR